MNQSKSMKKVEMILKKEDYQENQEVQNNKQHYVSIINTYLENYLKHKDKVSVFISILLLFKCKNYNDLEYNQLITVLLNDFNKNKKYYLFKRNSRKKNICEEFLEKIQFEINNNESFQLNSSGQKTYIQLDLSRVGEYLNNGNEEGAKDIHNNYNKENENQNENEYENEMKSKSVLKKKHRRTIYIKENKSEKKKYKKNIKSDDISIRDSPLIDLNENDNDNESEEIISQNGSKNSNKNMYKNKIKMEETENGIDNNINSDINIKEEENHKEDEKINNDIFSKKLYNTSEFNNMLDKIPKTTGELVEKVQKTKDQINELENKIKYVNQMIQELKNDKSDYDSIKKMVGESQFSLDSIYNIIKNELKSITMFTKIINYDQNLYNIHKNTIQIYREDYLNILGKFRQNLNNLIKLEENINNKKEDIRNNLDEIVSLNKQIIKNININFYFLQKNNSSNNIIDSVNVEVIVQEFLGKVNELIDKFNIIEKKSLVEEKNEEPNLKNEVNGKDKDFQIESEQKNFKHLKMKIK